MKLLDIEREKQILIEWAIEHDGEITPEIKSLMEDLKDKQVDKVDRIGRLWQHFNLQVESLSKEIEYNTKKLKSIESAYDRFKEFLKYHMKKFNIDKFSGNVYSISIQKNCGKKPLIIKRDPSTDIDNPYIIEKITYRYDTDKIRDDIESGILPMKSDWYSLEEPGEHVRLR